MIERCRLNRRNEKGKKPWNLPAISNALAMFRPFDANYTLGFLLTGYIRTLLKFLAFESPCFKSPQTRGWSIPFILFEIKMVRRKKVIFSKSHNGDEWGVKETCVLWQFLMFSILFWSAARSCRTVFNPDISLFYGYLIMSVPIVDAFWQGVSGRNEPVIPEKCQRTRDVSPPLKERV